MTSTTERRGTRELSDAIQAHRQTVLNEERKLTLTKARREYHVRSLFQQCVEEILANSRTELETLPVDESFRLIADKLRSISP